MRKLERRILRFHDSALCEHGKPLVADVNQ
jgi:hypothetical protein